MKTILSKIWEKIKSYRAVIIMYFASLIITVVSDIIFGGFNVFKYIAYTILFVILVIIMIVYKQKIKEAVDKIEDKVDSEIEKINK